MICENETFVPYESELLQPSDPEFLVYSLVCTGLVLSAGTVAEPGGGGIGQQGRPERLPNAK